MSPALSVLRALFRATISHRGGRRPITVDDLVVRVGGTPSDVRRALAQLARAELVQRTATGPRLTLGGLAVAASLAAPVAAKKAVKHEAAPHAARPRRASTRTAIAEPRTARAA